MIEGRGGSTIRVSGNYQKIKIGLVQINNSFSGQNYLPLSIGLLQAYVQRHAATPDRYEFLMPIYSRIRVKQAIAQLNGADVIGFSCYVWNIRISLEIAKILKQRKPDTLIVFGGPQVPNEAEGFLREHHFVDIVCHGEGERVFLAILENEPSRSWGSVPSVSYLQKNGSFVCQARAQRIKDLSEIPSPYLENVFDDLIAANPDEKWLILWETNRGCPFSCSFCDWGSATTTKMVTFDIERLRREVDWFAARRIEFIFCCDSNFGILPRDLDIVEYVAQAKRNHGYPHALSVQNTKNATERAYNVQRVLSDTGLNKGATLSLQSTDLETLKNVGRKNISLQSFRELQRRFARDNIETYTDMILGLPGETYDSFVNGVSEVIENGQHNRIQFNNLASLPNAEMGKPEYRRQHGLTMVTSKIINIHGSLGQAEEISELQELCIATKTMPREDWVRTRAFCWMTALLHFDKVLQIPLILVHETGSVSYRELLEAFYEGKYDLSPILSEIRAFFNEKARDIQNGGPEFCQSKEWLNIWWPADEYILIKLCVEDKLNEFYREAEETLRNFLESKHIDQPPLLLLEAIKLNRNLMKLPFQTEDLKIKVLYNVWEFYQSVLTGAPISLERREHMYHIHRTGQVFTSWDEWCREVIWYGNKKGAYLYGSSAVERQLEGHF